MFLFAKNNDYLKKKYPKDRNYFYLVWILFDLYFLVINSFRVSLSVLERILKNSRYLLAIFVTKSPSCLSAVFPLSNFNTASDKMNEPPTAIILFKLK